jgi:hypothetical protein
MSVVRRSLDLIVTDSLLKPAPLLHQKSVGELASANNRS